MYTRHTLRRICLAMIRDTLFENLSRIIWTRVFQPRAAKYDGLTSKIIEMCCERQSNCVDVGAYRGTILKKMARVATEGVLYAFEPVPMNYNYLVKQYPDAITYDFALSDVDGSHEFHYVSGRPARSGLYLRDYPDKKEIVEKLIVQTRQLDRVIPSDVPIRFMKVDVEGSELQVFRGAERTIRKHKPTILFEHGGEHKSNSESCYEILVDHFGMNIRTARQFLDRSEPLSKDSFFSELYDNNEYYFVASYKQ